MQLSSSELFPIQWGVAIGASAIGALTDIRSQTIPNRLTAPVLVAGLAWATWVGGWQGTVESVAGMLIMAAPFVLLFAFAGGGAGDAKLMGALGAWLGIVNGLAALLAVVLAGAALGSVYALAKRRASSITSGVRSVLTWAAAAVLTRSIKPPAKFPDEAEMLPLPYGTSILSGVCVAAIGVWLWRT